MVADAGASRLRGMNASCTVVIGFSTASLLITFSRVHSLLASVFQVHFFFEDHLLALWLNESATMHIATLYLAEHEWL